LPLRLDSLRRHSHAEAMAEPDDGPQHAAGRGRLVECSREAPVDLELGEGELAEIGEAGIAGAEVIERHADPHVTQQLQLAQHQFAVDHQRTLGDLKFQPVGRQ